MILLLTLEAENFVRLIDDGYLSPLVTKCMDTEYDIESVGIRGGEFIQSDLQKKMNDQGRTEKVIQEVLIKGQSRKQWLIFVRVLAMQRWFAIC